MHADFSVEELVEMLGLRPLEGEGGFFRRTWFRAPAKGDKPESSCILYLVTPTSFSSLHRLVHDEMFHFYLGDPCQTITMNENGVLEETILGQDIRSGMKVQHLVPGGTWQATRLLQGGRFALLGTTMSPGFHASEFELATPALIDGLESETRKILREVLPSGTE